MANGGLSVDLGGDGPTANDPADTDEGANHLQNHPELTGAAAALAVPGSPAPWTRPPRTFTVDSMPPPPAGRRARRVASPPRHPAPWSPTAPATPTYDVSPTPVRGWVVAATATAGLDTSEYSGCVTVSG